MRRSSSIRCLSEVIGETSSDDKIRNRARKEGPRARRTGASQLPRSGLVQQPLAPGIGITGVRPCEAPKMVRLDGRPLGKRAGWRHEAVLEKIVPSKSTQTKPVCIAGQRQCPPEDVGGPSGYQEFLEVIFEPGHAEFSHSRGWAGGKFHAEEFDVRAVNKVLERMRWPVF